MGMVIKNFDGFDLVEKATINGLNIARGQGAPEPGPVDGQARRPLCRIRST
jgi:hypothetical protein